MGEGEREVGGGDVFSEPPLQPHADEFRRREWIGLAERRHFGFKASDAPAHDAKRVDHGRVGIAAERHVREGKGNVIAFVQANDGRHALQMNLMNDAAARRKDVDAGKGLLRPFQEAVAFAVAGVFTLKIALRRGLVAGHVDLQRMVDHERDGDLALDEIAAPASACDRGAQCCEIHQDRDA